MMVEDMAEQFGAVWTAVAFIVLYLAIYFTNPFGMVHPSDRSRRLVSMETMQQNAPYPEILDSLVERCTYRAGWKIFLQDIERGQGSKGLTLCVNGIYPDSYHPDTTIRVMHYFIVPAAAYDERSWRRWLFERLLEVERHEAAEFFQIDGERPYAPHHGPGNDPYIIFEHGSDEDVRTSFRGDLKSA